MMVAMILHEVRFPENSYNNSDCVIFNRRKNSVNINYLYYSRIHGVFDHERPPCMYLMFYSMTRINTQGPLHSLMARNHHLPVLCLVFIMYMSYECTNRITS